MVAVDTICGRHLIGRGERVERTATASDVGNESSDAAVASWTVVVGEGDGSGGSGAVVLALTWPEGSP